jgi:exonuclease III
MSKHLKIFNYEYPDNPAAKGIAIVLNREITNTEGVKIHYLIPGKAILAIVPWHGTQTLTVLGLYAPTESDEAKISYWNSLCNLWLTTDLPVPDAIGGDFNLVSDAIDRLPHRTDSDAVVAAYLRFTCLMEAKDGWRQTNPDTKAYTHVSTHGTLSRIDRILVSPTLMKNCSHWGINDTAGGLTDHRMVSTMISAPGAPYIGRGRWAMPLFLLHDKEFMDLAMEKACELEGSMHEPRTELTNAQTKFKSFKDSVTELAQKRAKTAVGASEKKWKTLVNEPEVLLKNKLTETQDVGEAHNPASAIESENQSAREEPTQQTEGKSQEEIAELIAAIKKSIDEIVDCQRERKRLETRVRGFTELNHITKYAVNLSKDPKPRDTLTYLRRTDITPEVGSKRSSEMAEIARNYHNNLQKDELELDNDM